MNMALVSSYLVNYVDLTLHVLTARHVLLLPTCIWQFVGVFYSLIYIYYYFLYYSSFLLFSILDPIIIYTLRMVLRNDHDSDNYNGEGEQRSLML